MICPFLKTHRYKILSVLCFALGFFLLRDATLCYKGSCDAPKEDWKKRSDFLDNSAKKF